MQTLAATVERLTKQNHDLEEQLHQRDTEPWNQEEEQEGDSLQHTNDWQNKEGLEGSNALSRPSITDTTLPHMVVKMQMIKERMDFMMIALKGWVSNDLDEPTKIHKRGNVVKLVRKYFSSLQIHLVTK